MPSVKRLPSQILVLALISAMSVSVSPCVGQALPDYYQRNHLLMAPPASFKNGLLGFSNPANLATLSSPEMRLVWRSDPEEPISFQDGGLFLGLPGIGFSFVRHELTTGRRNDYKISLAGGTNGMAVGLGYGWSGGQGADKMLTAGFILRPNMRLSFGMIGNLSLERSRREAVVDFGLRPFGNELLTLFADAAMQDDDFIENVKWSSGAVLTPVTGLNIIGRYFENNSFSIGIAANLGRAGLLARGDFSKDQGFAQSTYTIRTGGMMPRILQDTFDRRNRYVNINLGGRIDYHRFRFFDDDTTLLYQILKNIKAASNDPRVELITLNLSGMRVLPEHAWEIREAVKAAKMAGKQVMAFLDNAHMTSYHLASIADWIILDPQGNISLPGYVLSKTYLKGTLDKLGLGFDEWRFFEYKSAAEILSRESMSDADRRQNTAYVDDRYELVRREICKSRNLSEDQFDAIIDEEVFLLPSTAQSRGLVDKIDRHSSIDEIIKSLTGRALKELPAEELYENAMEEDIWGNRPKIALVYALGPCTMDRGIRARWLEKELLRLASDTEVKAIVFRVDSPGGEGLASDMVAQALRECARKKPVIVSQGQVAGSGGYWISMYGDKIVAGPTTVTGSIGVIGGWLYDDGFSEHVGMTSDLVKRGEHADLWYGVRLPFLGTIPARNLDTYEKEKMKSIILSFYEDFLEKVAEGRNLSVEVVRSIAEGRIYSGLDGMAVGLVDTLGGLMTAIDMAKEELPAEMAESIEIIEIPEFKGLIDLGVPSASIRNQIEYDPVFDFINILSDNQGQPLFMLYPGTYPDFPQ